MTGPVVNFLFCYDYYGGSIRSSDTSFRLYFLMVLVGMDAMVIFRDIL